MRIPHCSRNRLVLLAIVLMLPAACMPFYKARTAEVDQLRTQALQYIDAGDYRSALRVYDGPCRKYSRDARFFRNYRNAQEDIYRTAEKAFGREDFSVSGRAYYALVHDHAYCRRLLHEPPPEKGLRERLEESSTYLSQRALAQYRKGDLAQAISIWREILAFDPNNAGIRKAVDKATIQMKSLRQQ